MLLEGDYFGALVGGFLTEIALIFCCIAHAHNTKQSV
jgi:hypothetical protein